MMAGAWQCPACGAVVKSDDPNATCDCPPGSTSERDHYRDLAQRLGKIEQMRRSMARDPSWQTLWQIVSDEELNTLNMEE